MAGGRFEQAFGMAEAVSPAMRDAVGRWYALYYDGGVGPGRNAGQRLPYAIVSKLCKTVFSEYAAHYSGGGAKVQAMNRVLAALDEAKQGAMQHAMIGGECLLKPVVEADGVAFRVIRRPNYCVLGRAADGGLTAVGTCEVVQSGGETYTLLEKRTALPGGRLRLENRLYRAPRPSGLAVGRPLGTPVPLATLPQYAALREVAELDLGMEGVGLVLLRMPMANCVDASADGVSVYEAAAGLIEAAYRLEAAFEKEFANAASRVIASADLLREDGQGKRLEDDLFVAVDEDPALVGITVYSPAIRQESYLARKNDLLRDIESVVGLKRGMLSEANASERTATEITSSSGEYNMTVNALQGVWRQALLEAARLADRLGQLYLGWGSEAVGEPLVDFGDGALFNREQVWQEYCGMVQNGWLRPEVALGWYFGLQAEEAEGMEKIRALMP